MRKKIIVIIGQTATGKSSLAVKVAKHFDGEIISADSRQVYRGLNIGTGKITKREMRGIEHYLLDVADPKTRYTVAEYREEANEKIKSIISKNKIPIICGGTGFYIDSITKGIIFPEVAPNVALRKKLEKKSAIELFKMLEKLDPRRAKNIDSENKVRLIRAIEIGKELGNVPIFKTSKPSYQFIKIGLRVSPLILQAKIKKRVDKMFKDGLENEIKSLHKAGLSQERIREFGFEYNDPTPEKVKKSTLQYAKRQITWFKRDKQVKWFEPSEEKKILTFLSKKLKNNR